MATDYKVEEVQHVVGAITANQAAGFHLDSFPNAFTPRSWIDWVLVDNRSEATLVLISDPSRPDILPGERKRIDTADGFREVYVEANATVNSGEVRLTLGVVR